MLCAPRFQLLHDAERRAGTAEASLVLSRREAHFAGATPGPYEPPVPPSVRGIAGRAPSDVHISGVNTSSGSGSGSGSGSRGSTRPGAPSNASKFKSLSAAMEPLAQPSPALRRAPADVSSLAAGPDAGGGAPVASTAAGGGVSSPRPRNVTKEAAAAGINVADIAEMLFNDLESISASYVQGLQLR